MVPLCFSEIGRELERFVRDPTDVVRTKGCGFIAEEFERNEAEAQAGNPPATQFMNMVETDHVNLYIPAAMKKYELEQARMSVGRSTNYPPEPKTDIPDVDMESVGLRLSRSHNHDRERRD